MENLLLLGSDPEASAEVEKESIDFNENLLNFIDQDEAWLKEIGSNVLNNFEIDSSSRNDWVETCKRGVANLGLKAVEVNDPWPGACSVTHPVILEAAINFQAKASPELLPAGGPVKTQIYGKVTEEKQGQALRVKEYMNYLLTKEMPEYYHDMEKLLFYLPLYGSAFKKTYYDHSLDKPVSEFVSPFDVVVPYNASDLFRAERFSEISTCSTKEMESLVAKGYYNDLDLLSSYNTMESFTEKENSEIGLIPLQSQEKDKSYTLITQYLFLKIPSEFKIPLARSEQRDPYCVTIEKESGRVLRISRNWREWDNVFRQRKVHHVHYKYIPGFSFYGLGYFHLLGNWQATLTAILRSLVDSGELANMQGGFRLKGTKIVGDNSTFTPGEWKEMEASSQDLQKALYPLQYKEPSRTLYEMWRELTQMSQKFADSADQVVADSTNYGPVGTTVALLEHSMKMFSAIHKRVHKSQEIELKILSEVLFEYFPQQEYPYDVIGESRTVFKQDFDPKIIDVIPVSDPNVFSQAQRLALAQAKLQAAQTFPAEHNLKAILREFHIALGEQDPDRLLGEDPSKAPPPPPQDPLSDILSIVRNKPVKAYPGQDHQAHILFKSAWLEDPVGGGQTPLMQPFIPLVQADIREHQIMMYQESIAAQSVVQGVAADAKTQEMLLAQAAQALLKMNKMLVAQGLDQEPIQKIAEAELIKAKVDQGELSHKAQTDAAKLALEAQKIDVARQREVNRAAEAGMKASQLQFDSMRDSVERGLDRLENAQKSD